MPCEPVTSGVPTRPSSSSSTSSVAFRMKRVDSGGGGSSSGARRALTALGTNDTKHNLRLAKSLLTISQDKFAKKWNFDPILEVPLAGQGGRFSWTPTISSSPCALSGLDLTTPSSCQLLDGLTSSSGPRAAVVAGAAASHDLATTEAEDNAAALRTCMNLPKGPGLAHSDNHLTGPLTPSRTGPLHQAEPRVPPIHHPEEPSSSMYPVGPSSSPLTPVTAGDANRDTTCDVNIVGASTQLHSTSQQPHTPAEVSSTNASSRRSVVHVSPCAASDGPPPSVDNEVVSAEAPQDNQCQQIDPTITTTPTHVPTDESRLNTQTCITNYLHPRKRSSAHLKEAVHPSKAKKVMLAA